MPRGVADEEVTPPDSGRGVTEWLKEKPRDASEALPFHALLGERIDSVVLTTIYDAARSEGFTNRGVGLVP